MKKYLESIGKNSCRAFTSKVNNKEKNKVLKKFFNLIEKNKSKIIKQNKKDIYFAKRKGLRKNLIELGRKRIKIFTWQNTILNLNKIYKKFI